MRRTNESVERPFARGRECAVAWLSVCIENRLKHAVHVVDDAWLAAKIGADMDDSVIPEMCNRSLRPIIAIDIGATERVDGLLGIADDKQCPITKDCILPPVGHGAGGDRKQDTSLDRIGILKFVDKDMRKALTNRCADNIVRGDKGMSTPQQIIEIEDGGISLAFGVKVSDRVEGTRHLTDHGVADLAEQFSKLYHTGAEMLVGLLGESWPVVLPVSRFPATKIARFGEGKLVPLHRGSARRIGKFP